MAVQFVIGRAGSGKTFRCFRGIVDAMRAEPLGPPIYWVVPKQGTFQAERELTCGSGLGAFCRCRVASFDQLTADVLEAAGGCAIPEVTPLGRQMVIAHLLRTHGDELQFFKSVAHQIGLAARLDATLAEIERNGQSPGDLQAQLAELETTGPADIRSSSLLPKLKDIALIATAYAAYLGDNRLDPQRRLEQVLACAEQCGLFDGATIYVDGFTAFTGAERRLLAAIAKAARHVEVALTLDPGSQTLADSHHIPADDSLFHRTEDAYRRLYFTFHEAGVTIADPVLLRETPRFTNGALLHVEQQLFSVGGGSSFLDGESGASNPVLVEAPDARAEVDAAARHVRRLLQDHGLRLRDVAVLVRDLEPTYHQLIDAAFREHGLAYFADVRRTAAHHPLLQFTRAAFTVAAGEWPHDALMLLVKTGLAGLGAAEADRLENYVLVHRIRGRAWAAVEPWGYHRRLTLAGEEEGAPAAEAVGVGEIDCLRRGLIGRLAPFVEAVSAAEKVSFRQAISAIFTLFESFGVRETLSRWMVEAGEAGRLEEAAEHEQVWAELVGLFEQMLDLLGDQPVSLADLIDTLDSGLERFDLALTPPTVDQILVGQVDRTRTPGVKAVVLLGLSEGIFPRATAEDSILSDPDRRLLARQRINLEGDSHRRLLDEDFLGYSAFTRAAEHLVVTRPVADEKGKPLAPSPFWTRLTGLFPGVGVERVPRDVRAAPQFISSPRQLVTGLMRWVRRPEDHSGDYAALYEHVRAHPCDGSPLDRVRFMSWKALQYANAATLSREVAGRLFPSPLAASVAQVETFATCPFRHYLRYGLVLRERDAHELSPRDLSAVYHEVLEKVVREVVKDRVDLAALAPKVAEDLIRKHAAEVGRALRGELQLPTARNKYLLRRIEKTLAQVVAAQQSAAARGRLRPAFAEVEFGDGPTAALPAFVVKTPAGGEVRLWGKIDRVDTIAEEGAAAVIDYKLTGIPLALENVYHGISLQLLTYLLVLEQGGEQLAGRQLTPVAAFYVKLLRQLEQTKDPEGMPRPGDPNYHLVVKPRGIVDESRVTDVDGRLRPSSFSDVVNAYVSKDGSFGRRGSTDVASPGELAGLLGHVRSKLVALSEQLLSGMIDVAPYRIHRKTPCLNCEYRAVCRFDSAADRYHHLRAMRREDVLREVLEKNG